MSEAIFIFPSVVPKIRYATYFKWELTLFYSLDKVFYSEFNDIKLN